MHRRRAAFAAALVLGVAFVVVTGGLGKGMSGQGGLDFAFVYIAGKTWLAGFNAYEFAQRQGVVATLGLTPALVGPLTQNIPSFVYPPNIFPLAALVAGFDFETGRTVMKLVSLASALVMVGMLALRGVAAPGAPDAWPADADAARTVPWWLPLAVLGSPFCAHVLWQGQTSLVASAALVAAWVMYTRRSPVAAGVLLGLALIKPQLSVYVALWFLLQREWKLLLAAAATVLLCALPALALPDPVSVVHAWLADIAIHRTAEVVQPGFRHLMGVQSVLSAAGLSLPSLFPVGAALTVAVWAFRRRLDADAVLALLIATVFLFSFVQDYDLVLVAPALVYLFAAARRSLVSQATNVLIVGLLAFPMRFVQDTHLPLLLHYRTVGIALMAGAVLVHATNKMRASQAGRLG